MITPERVRELLKDATAGPWRWFGNTEVHTIYLATVNRGRIFIMTFFRWGGEGTPAFRVTDSEGKNSRMVDAADLARYEVAPDATSKDDPRLYRHDFQGLRHPDAELIAAAPEIAEAYLEMAAKVERVAALADKWEHGALRWADPLPVPPEVGLIREALAGPPAADAVEPAAVDVEPL